MQQTKSNRLPIIRELVFSEGGFTLLFVAPPIVISFLLATLPT